MSGITSGFEGLLDDRRSVAAGVVVVLALATVPFTTTAYVTDIVFTGLVFVMLGVSWNLIAGYAGQISLGHAAFFGTGAFIAAWITAPGRASLPQWIQPPVVPPFLAALVAGALGAALLAAVLGPLLFRLTGHYFAIGTLAMASIIQLVLLDQRWISGGSTGYYVPQTVGHSHIFLLMLAATVGTVLVTYYIVNSRAGLGMRAIHDDEAAASSLGVSPLTYKMYAFVVSSAMAGLAGAFYAQFTLYVNPESTVSVTWMVDTLVVVILGGMGTMVGPVLGAGLFLTLDVLLRRFAGEFATVIEGALIILFIVFVPRGMYALLTEWTDDEESPPAGGASTADGGTASDAE